MKPNVDENLRKNLLNTRKKLVNVTASLAAAEAELSKLLAGRRRIGSKQPEYERYRRLLNKRAESSHEIKTLKSQLRQLIKPLQKEAYREEVIHREGPGGDPMNLQSPIMRSQIDGKFVKVDKSDDT